MCKWVDSRVLVVFKVCEFEFERFFGDLDWLKVEDQLAVTVDNVGDQLSDGDEFLVLEVFVELLFGEGHLFI